MTRIFLQNIADDLKFEDLPPEWNSFDLESFSKTKKLWDYQQEAVKSAIKVLWKYYEDFQDYQKSEDLDKNRERKEQFIKWYLDNGMEDNLDIKLDKRKRKIYPLLTGYYAKDDSKIPYMNFINRLCFWMATGSGKSLIIIKLVRVLHELMKRGEIPSFDILVLTHRDDLIEQLKNHVDEFNYASDTRIILRGLRDYAEVKRQQTLIGITIFYYRSDNLSDEQKEKIIDFKNYDNDGKWFVFLDEAHKGDKEESKRQHIYSILSRNGFLFNSSATFIDSRDIITTAYNFNLERFINAGYGKHISILKQEIRAFKDEEEDYSGEEKQKIVLKSLILLTYIKKYHKKIVKVRKDMYHNPLLLTLVNSVNTEDADLKLFFREIERIGKGEVGQKILKQAVGELWEELKQEPDFMFEQGNKVKIDKYSFTSITKEDILTHVFNSKTTGEIEILIRPSNRQELAFKLKTSNRPFALIKIGDISGWLKDELSGYEIQERFEDESYFQNLNKEESDINILMGSRSFYEGWDSNRPNVINYINIGTGEDAKKFILQSVGRGVRIEPVKSKRKRVLSLYNAKEIGEELFNKIKDKVLPVETLFIFGTNRKALETVIKELEKERKKEGGTEISLYLNKDAHKHKLLIPVYKVTESPMFKAGQKAKFEVSEADFKTLNNFVDFMSEDRVLLMRYNASPEKLTALREGIKDKQSYKIGERNFKDVDLLIQRILDYYDVCPEAFEKLKELGDEIKHFKNIKVFLEDVSAIKKKIELMKDYPLKVKELEEQYGKIPPKEFIRKQQELEQSGEFEHEHQKIQIKYIANHYYFPIILTDEEKISYISHIIKTPSEVKFVRDIEEYCGKEGNKLKEFDWWMFSKLDETLDEIYIPYYNSIMNRISKFNPDFIFWMGKGKNYLIVLVDPKGTEHTSAYRKIDGYRELFEEDNKEKIFKYNGYNVKVRLLLRPKDIAYALKEYRAYWFDNMEKMFEEAK